MNCKEFKIEFEDTRVLSETATLHLGECPDCKVLHLELTQIWRMIEALPQVEAPSDFDFRLKARMANAKPSDFQPGWWTSLRYVVPVFAAALVLTLFLASQNFFISSPEVSQIPAENQERQAEIPQPPVVVPPQNEIAADKNPKAIENPPVVAPDSNNFTAENSNRNSMILVSETQNKRRVVPRRETVEDADGDSRVISAEPPKVFILPKGIEPSNPQSTENPENVTQIKPIPVEAVLSEIGIEVVSENGKRKVKSVELNSPAQRSGVQVGDEIEAIDENKLDKPIQSAAIKVKVLTVTRNGKTEKITLSSEPK